MVQVNIYYETLDTEVTEEKPAYDLNDFGCKYELYVTYSRFFFRPFLNTDTALSVSPVVLQSFFTSRSMCVSSWRPKTTYISDKSVD